MIFQVGETIQVVLLTAQGFAFVGLPLGRVWQVLVKVLVPVSLELPADGAFVSSQLLGYGRLGLAFLVELVNSVPFLGR